jgi:N-acetyl-anhydromuramyl-L-alanine amidase AmpD
VGKRLGEYTIDEPDGRCVAYHFAWFESLGAYVQTVPMNLRAFHAGAAGNHWLGVGLPGPYGRDPRRQVVYDRTVQLARDLVAVMAPVLRYWCRHSDIAADRKDPGPGFKDSWMASAGLVWRRA